MAGRAATIEELDLVRTELERMRIRTDVLNQDIFRLNTRVGDLYELSDERFDRLEAKVDAIGAKVDRMEERIGQMEARIGQMEDRIGQMEERIGQMEERIVQRILAAIAGLQGTRN